MSQFRLYSQVSLLCWALALRILLSCGWWWWWLTPLIQSPHRQSFCPWVVAVINLFPSWGGPFSGSNRCARCFHSTSGITVFESRASRPVGYPFRGAKRYRCWRVVGLGFWDTAYAVCWWFVMGTRWFFASMVCHWPLDMWVGGWGWTRTAEEFGPVIYKVRNWQSEQS